MRRVFPDRPIVDLADDDPIFHTFWDLEEREQIPGLQFLYQRPARTSTTASTRTGAASTTTRGASWSRSATTWILGDAVEHSDTPQYPAEYSAIAMRTFLNYIVYAMTH